MNTIAKNQILLKTLPFAILMVVFKLITHQLLNQDGKEFNELVEFSDISIIFTGAFFVFGLILSGIMVDFKESEKIPGEIACILESVQDWALVGVQSKRNKENNEQDAIINETWVKSEITAVNDGISIWLRGNDKRSETIYPLVRRINDMAIFLQKHGADKDCIKGIQDQANQLRKQVTRAYTIARTDFVAPAYTLQKSILLLILILLIISKFKSVTGAVVASGVTSFVFIYLFLLIRELDNPFNTDSKTGSQHVESKLLDKYKERINNTL